jgi:hypothetical protein
LITYPRVGECFPAEAEKFDDNNNPCNEEGTCMLIDVAIAGDRNLTKKEVRKILKYKDLTKEIEGMWNVKTK